MGVFGIYILGGEPFLRNDLFDLLYLARKKDIQVAVNSNGWFIDKKTSNKLKELDVSCVRVSIDGAFEKTHDFLRNKEGSFSRSIQAIKNLSKSGINRIDVVSTITRYNINETSEIIDLASRLNASLIQVIPLSPTGRGVENFKNLALNSEEYQKLRHLLELKNNEYDNNIIIDSIDGVLDSQCTKCVSAKNVLPDFMGCRAGRTACNINYNGDVIPCLMVREPVVGNVRNKSFKDIWLESSLLNKWRSKHLQFSECRHCQLNNIYSRECPMSSTQKNIDNKKRKNNMKKFKPKYNHCLATRCLY